MPRKYYYGYKPSNPVNKNKGIKVNTPRGEIGKKWWSKRFIETLKKFGWSNRLDRGKRYARSGQVLDIDIKKGGINARVQGSMSRPYKVDIHYPASDEQSWEKIIEEIKKNPEISASILNGVIPPDMENIFKKADSELFTENKKNIKMNCSCPDYAVPCKHIAAVFYVLADNFDNDPFLLLQLKGKSRSEIMDKISENKKTKIKNRNNKKDDISKFWSYRPLKENKNIESGAVSPLLKYPLPDDFGDPELKKIFELYYDEISSKTLNILGLNKMKE